MNPAFPFIACLNIQALWTHSWGTIFNLDFCYIIIVNSHQYLLFMEAKTSHWSQCNLSVIIQVFLRKVTFLHTSTKNWTFSYTSKDLDVHTLLLVWVSHVGSSAFIGDRQRALLPTFQLKFSACMDWRRGEGYVCSRLRAYSFWYQVYGVLVLKNNLPWFTITNQTCCRPGCKRVHWSRGNLEGQNRKGFSRTFSIFLCKPGKTVWARLCIHRCSFKAVQDTHSHAKIIIDIANYFIHSALWHHLPLLKLRASLLHILQHDSVEESINK